MHKSDLTESTDKHRITAHPGLLRRLIAMVYDGFLLIGLFALVSTPIVMQVGEQALTSNLLLLNLHRAILGLTAFLFFGWFWIHGGQTLGMRAWRIRVEKTDGTAMDWPSSAKRFLGVMLSWGFLGLGYLWILIDRDKLAWHDRLSATRLVMLPKKSS